MCNGGSHLPRRKRWSRALARALLALVASLLPVALAHAALLMQSNDVSGGLLYAGLGDVGGGVGSGRYTFTNCVVDPANTRCSLHGRYTETAQSTHAPGQSGEFTLRMHYFGSGITPVIAHSDTAGSDALRFTSVGDAVFTLTYRTAGPAVPFDPHVVQATAVGDATFVFADGNHATFAYNVHDGANVGSQTKAITREIFAAPGTVCN